MGKVNAWEECLEDHATGELRWVTPGLNRVSLYFPGLKEPGEGWEIARIAKIGNCRLKTWHLIPLG